APKLEAFVLGYRENPLSYPTPPRRDGGRRFHEPEPVSRLLRAARRRAGRALRPVVLPPRPRERPRPRLSRCPALRRHTHHGRPTTRARHVRTHHARRREFQSARPLRIRRAHRPAPKRPLPTNRSRRYPAPQLVRPDPIHDLDLHPTRGPNRTRLVRTPLEPRQQHR